MAGTWFKNVLFYGRSTSLAGLQVLPEKRSPRSRLESSTGLEVDTLEVHVAHGAANWHLIWGKDEGMTLGDDFGEPGRPLPTFGEGPDAVDSPYIGEGS